MCEEFKQGIANLINGSSLPPFLVELILQNYLYEISNIAKNQYQLDKAQYEKFLSDSDENNKNKEIKES